MVGAARNYGARVTRPDYSLEAVERLTQSLGWGEGWIVKGGQLSNPTSEAQKSMYHLSPADTAFYNSHPVAVFPGVGLSSIVSPASSYKQCDGGHRGTNNRQRQETTRRCT